MTETLSTSAANRSDPGHDVGFSFSPLAEGARPLPATAPPVAELRTEIRGLLEDNPPFQPGDAALLALMGQHDAALGAALLKLPEREGAGGAAIAHLARKYRGAVDVFKCVRMTAATLIFWPDEVPGDEQVEDAALRLADLNLDAAKELARAYIFLGPRFTLKHSLRVVLDKYKIPAEQFSAANGTPVDGLSVAGVEAMLARGQIDLLNEMLRPFEITIRQKIGTVNPVFSLVEKANGRHVMPTGELIEFLRKRDVFA
jgi:hypothetical protein